MNKYNTYIEGKREKKKKGSNKFYEIPFAQLIPLT